MFSVERRNIFPLQKLLPPKTKRQQDKKKQNKVLIDKKSAGLRRESQKHFSHSKVVPLKNVEKISMFLAPCSVCNIHAKLWHLGSFPTVVHVPGTLQRSSCIFQSCNIHAKRWHLGFLSHHFAGFLTHFRQVHVYSKVAIYMPSAGILDSFPTTLQFSPGLAICEPSNIHSCSGTQIRTVYTPAISVIFQLCDISKGSPLHFTPIQVFVSDLSRVALIWLPAWL